MRRFLLLIAIFILNTRALADVTVFAAASLKDALDEISESYTAQTGGQISQSYGGSGVLARQILAGAPADIFVSANVEWVDALEGEIDLLAGRALLGNRLVVIAGFEGQFGSVEALKMIAPEKIALGFVQSVPAGQYAKEALDYYGLWAEFAPDIVQTENVRAALWLVERGEVGGAVVYQSDALAAKNAHVIAEFPEESHQRIVYPAALFSEAGRDFFEYLQGAEAEAVFVQYGFEVLSE